MNLKDQKVPKVPKVQNHSLIKAIAIINSFSNDKPNLRLKDISNLTGISQPTAYRLLATMKDYNLISQNDDGQYSLGRAFLRYEGIVLNSMTLRKISLPYLEELSSITKCNANLAVLDENEVLYIARAEMQTNSSCNFHAGMRRPVYCTGLGKVLICNNPEKVKDIFQQGVRKYTLNTITDEKKFFSEIKKVHLQGYATDFEEWGNGINCIAAPVYDSSEKIVAGISISGPTSIFPVSKILELVPILIECVNRLSVRLGSQKKDF